MSPAVYRFICPDGRSYVGSAVYSDIRHYGGIARSNRRLASAFKKHAPETWTFEILERLEHGCSEAELRAAEQHHIERLLTLYPAFGFNVNPAALPDLAIHDERGKHIGSIAAAYVGCYCPRDLDGFAVGDTCTTLAKAIETLRRRRGEPARKKRLA